jgi:hypothetical protein
VAAEVAANRSEVPFRRCGDLVAGNVGAAAPGVITLARLVARVRAQVLPVAGSVPESVVNASRLVFQGRADDRD